MGWKTCGKLLSLGVDKFTLIAILFLMSFNNQEADLAVAFGDFPEEPF